MSDIRITAAMNRRNGAVYLSGYLLIFLAAPVIYVGVVQAALCDKLGSNATVANLPSAAYLFGGFAPLLLSLTVPHRYERVVVTCANGTTALFLGLVWVALAARLPASVTLAILIAQGLIQGFSASTAQVFTLQCLARGATLEGRSQIFKRTYLLTPIFAVIGSLGAQYILNGRLRLVTYPNDFALLYAIGFFCMAGVTLLSFLFQLAPVLDEPKQPLFRELSQSSRRYAQSRPLMLLFIVYTLWNCALSVTPNLALYTRHAIGQDPKNFSGLIMAIRFGCKSVGGYLLGTIALRQGLRASVLACSLLIGVGTLWGWFLPGYSFLFAFGLLGAGELGGAYIPNYAVALSTPETTTRNLSLLALAQPASSFSPALFGYLADRFGFGASFTFGIIMAVGALWFTLEIREESHGEMAA